MHEYPSGYESVLGLKNNDGPWEYKRLADPIIGATHKEYNILVPEKLFYEMGKEYKNNNEAFLQADVKSMVNSYTKSIDEYLNNKEFSFIIIIGSSDGGALLPKVYSQLLNKGKISKLVIMGGGGGYSQLDEFRILAKSPINMPDGYRNILKKVDEALYDINNNPNSIDKFYLGHPYTRWSSYFTYVPLEYIKSWKRQVLFIHGEKDWSCPIESTKIIEDQNISDSFTFNYYKNMEHGPTNVFQMLKLKKDILNWIND